MCVCVCENGMAKILVSYWMEMCVFVLASVFRSSVRVHSLAIEIVLYDKMCER